MSLPNSVTTLSDFWKFLVTIFLTKVAQIIYKFLGYLEKLHSPEKTHVSASWVSFGNIWATFYSNIWPYCFLTRWLGFQILPSAILMNTYLVLNLNNTQNNDYEEWKAKLSKEHLQRVTTGSSCRDGLLFVGKSKEVRTEQKIEA